MAVSSPKLAGAPDQHGRERAIMVARHLAARGIGDPLVLAAMGAVPREAFVPQTLADFAYEDSALAIEAGQTISQPYIVARMIELLELEPTDRVLEVGAGSGYAAAVLGHIVARVYAIERHPVLVDAAAARLDSLGYRNIELRVGDGSTGWPEAAPFDAILVAAAGPEVPSALKAQLGLGGRLVMPVGGASWQRLLKITRLGDADFREQELCGVSFVPLVGEQGWPEPKP
jgi:protein-L-isoaspartate(D-aspartate) O-methyltransferase